jgi:hypothetical protein
LVCWPPAQLIVTRTRSVTPSTVAATRSTSG